MRDGCWCLWPQEPACLGDVPAEGGEGQAAPGLTLARGVVLIPFKLSFTDRAISQHKSGGSQRTMEMRQRQH